MGATKGEQTRKAILRAAIERFGRDGYRATSVADIARDAGVGGTVAYAYFPNKEALFLAAVDEDAAAVMEEGLVTIADAAVRDWRQTLLTTLVAAVERHLLARRLLAGLEPDVTDRVLEIPALAQLRKAIAERLRTEQASGAVRADIDPASMANGVVAIVLSLLMSVVQIGTEAAATYADDVIAVFEAAIERAPGPPGRRRG
ncbi:MAG TPA: helix-turn-helix domain-containing protein [Acidimicrobiales bacterium]|nr:helix-turn-helix domain-containing protein [Acidimicrobiales bacterium]